MATKLSDTALTTLATATARDNRRVLPLPQLKAPPVIVRKTIASMLTSGLVAAIAAEPEDELWETDAGERQTLIITDAGMAAIGVQPTPVEPAAAGDTAQPQPTAAATAEATSSAARPDGAHAKPGRRGPGRVRKPEPVAVERGPSKQGIVLAMLRRQQGASIREMMTATDWQAHSVRGFMSGALKRRLGIEVISEKGEDGVRRYFVAPIRTNSERG